MTFAEIGIDQRKRLYVMNAPATVSEAHVPAYTCQHEARGACGGGRGGEARARVARACRREARRLTRCVEGET